jgi:hypothetical protein
MKRLPFLTLGAAVGACLLLPTLAAQAGITGSPHDFSGESWNTSPADPNSVCGTCHQPHHASSSVVPLWGHATSKGPWIMYSALNSPTFKAQATQALTPQGASLACLSCHDGTVAVNQIAGGTYIGGTSAGPLTNSANIGTDLTHTHPISFPYNPALVGTGPNQDQWLYNPDSTTVLVPSPANGFVPGNDMTIKGFLLGGNYMLECSSCHDVHNQNGTPFSMANNPKLVKINGTLNGKGSLLCRSCHNK